MNKFDVYYEFLISENKKYNLTAITEKEEVFIKHFQDSINTNLVIDFETVETLCDIGSGAGFPGIPLKIKYPHLKLTIIEPTLKRCKFLEQLIVKLDLNEVTIINGRAEDISQLRNSFDVVVARAVSSLPILLELCIPYVKVNGYFIALKGSSYEEEVKASNNALKQLNSKIDNIMTYSLEKGYGLHSLIKIKKTNHTDLKYPRSYGNIKNKPL
jgi:16S rRNA (guanine527-N7)-methyltransferase